MNYSIGVQNGPVTDVIDITDTLPSHMEFVPGSATAVLTNGVEIQPLTIDGNQLSWSGQLDPGGLFVSENPSPFGYFPLASLGVAPFPAPGNPDDGGVILSGLPAFQYNGASYTEVIWSVNGTIEPGTASGLATGGFAGRLPDVGAPNNLIAPLWTDLDLTDDGLIYVAVLNAGPNQFIVFEWENVPLFSDLTNRYTFQVWILAGTDAIWFTYARLDNTERNMSVGVENSDGSQGFQYYYNDGGGSSEGTVPGADLFVQTLNGGSVQIDVGVKFYECPDNVLVNEVQLSAGDRQEFAYAASTCEKRPRGKGRGKKKR